MELAKKDQSDISASPTLRERAQKEVDTIILDRAASVVFWDTLRALALEPILDQAVREALDRLRQGQSASLDFAEDAEIVASYAREFLIDEAVERRISGESDRLS